MSRTVLKYVYFALGTGIAFFIGIASRKERRQLERQGSESRSPMEAATYRANELVERPLRTLSLVVGYVLLFAGVPACAAYTDRITELLGPDPGGIAEIIAIPIEETFTESVIPLLPAAGVVLGLVFALIVHQSLKTASDIRLRFSSG